MSVIARLEVIPQSETSMSDAVARAVQALDGFDVSYETTPTDTIIEAEDPAEVFAAAEAAHRAVDCDRLVTSLEVDDQRTRSQRGRERVESVERRLGRPPRRRRERGPSEQRPSEQRPSEQRPRERPANERVTAEQQPAGRHQPTEPSQKYGGPLRSNERTAGSRTGTSTRTSSRYLQPRRPVSR